MNLQHDEKIINETIAQAEAWQNRANELLTAEEKDIAEQMIRLFFVRSDGTTVPKFVNLDMEEYRDMRITAEAFIRTLEQDEFKDYSAGIVLQAYLPDSYSMQQELTTWAKARVSNGGSKDRILYFSNKSSNGRAD